MSALASCDACFVFLTKEISISAYSTTLEMFLPICVNQATKQSSVANGTLISRVELLLSFTLWEAVFTIGYMQSLCPESRANCYVCKPVLQRRKHSESDVPRWSHAALSRQVRHGGDIPSLPWNPATGRCPFLTDTQTFASSTDTNII